MAKLIIVSHRLPYTCSFEQDELQLKPSVGGLATGLMPLLKRDALWIGWHGYSQRLSRLEAQQIQDELAKKHCLALPLPIEKQKIFYNDVANGIIWPLYHYHADHLPMHLQGWEAYEEINRIYADFIAQHAQAGDTIWIHDYHLQVLPQMLREKNLQVKIGFFLHIPFPSYEIFRLLPWREEILEGILGSDLVGFHTASYGQYFRDAVREILGLESEDGAIVLDKRRVEIDAFPLGVDFNHWNENLTPEHSSLLASSLRNLKTEHPILRLLLSVDRLDYTKGLPRKLLAFERLLEQHEELRGLVSLVQIAPPSRDAVPVYGRYRKQVEELVGRINGNYGLPGYQPVQYIARSFSSDEISLLYPITDVMVVTPLRDGMNLVAKEFIASRHDEDGVLVLSELAGAAAELDEALKVNPYDIDKTAAVLFEAVTMDANERRLRMRAMRTRIETFDTHVWARTFIDRLQGVEDRGSDLEPSFQSPKDLALSLFESEKKIVLFIDHEGALQSPPHAPDANLKLLLSRISRSERCELHLLSMQTPDILQDWFAPLNFTIHSEYGAWTLAPQFPTHKSELSDPQSEAFLEKAARIMDEDARRTPGAYIERKTASISWHYRLSELSQSQRNLKRLQEKLEHQLPIGIFDIYIKRRSLELRLKSARVGSVIQRRALAKQDFETFVLIAGEPVLRESFHAIPGLDQLIAVGKGTPSSHFHLRDTGSVRETLRYLDMFLSSPGLQSFRSRTGPSQKADQLNVFPQL